MWLEVLKDEHMRKYELVLKNRRMGKIWMSRKMRLGSEETPWAEVQ